LTSSKSIHPYVLERIKARETGEMEAVVSASTGALQAVLPKLINLLTEEYKLHKGAKEGIRYIKSELVSMQVALEKAAEVSDQQVKLWARELRDMSYAPSRTPSIPTWCVSASLDPPIPLHAGAASVST
jgi:hypothetical protein